MQRSRRVVILSVLGICLLVMGGALALRVSAAGESAQVMAARWAGRPFANYAITIAVEHRGRECQQQLSVEGEQANILSNTCQLNWLSPLSVTTLYNFVNARTLVADCYPRIDCACRRVRSVTAVYNQELGYPESVYILNRVSPNLSHRDFWRAFWVEGRPPPCGIYSFDTRMTVRELTPLP